MTDTKDVAYVRERLCKATDVLDEVFVKTKEISEENTKLKELLKECRYEINPSYIEVIGGTKTFKNLVDKINQVLGEES